MMRVVAVHGLDVQRHPGIHGKGTEKLLCEAAVEIAAAPLRELRVEHQKRSAADVERTEGKRFIHRDVKAAVPGNPLLVPYRLQKSLTEGDADILGSVMSIHFEIALAADG